MSKQSGGANPRRGFEYQDYAAAYYFLCSDIHTIRNRPLELHVEEFDADFSFYLRSDYTHEHHFESKSKEHSEIKWGDFKTNILTEYADIYDEYVADTAHFHTVTSGTFATDVHQLFELAEKLREGRLSWSLLETKHGRTLLDPLKSELDIDDDDFYYLIWGLHGHSPTKDELELKIEKYLRQFAPTRFTSARKLILDEVHEPTGVIRREDLEDAANVSFDEQKHSSGESTSRNVQKLREEAEEMKSKYSGASANRQTIIEDRENSRAYGEALSDSADGDITESQLETHTTHIDTDFERLDKLEKEKAEIKRSISEGLEILLDMDESYSEGDSYE